MAITKEQFESLPDFARADYETHGDGYRLKAEGKAEALKASLNELDSKFKTTESRIAEIEAVKTAEIEQAKKQALESARSKGDVDAIEKRYKEQMEDLQKRSTETLGQYETRIKELESNIVSSNKNSYLADLRAKLKVFDDTAPIFDRVVGSMIDVDPKTGKRIYLGADGGATSLDDAGFFSQLESDAAISRLRQAQPPAQGGFASGSSNRGGASQQKTSAERIASGLKTL